MPDPSETTPYRPTPDPVGPRFAAGELLAGRYRVVAALGKGGMGEVYRADDLTLGQPVALKFLPQSLAGDPERLSRFRKEVAAARRVSHPNVCRVYDIAEHEGQAFLTMEFADGEDLAALLKKVGRLPEERGVELARQLCAALAAVHDQGLLHRDLKPANVLLDGRGHVRLADFGLAAAAQDLSAADVRSGTPLYQAPEQRAGREVTARSDIFSLGLVLYELFTGRRPFPGADHDTPPSKPSSHVSGLSPAVEQVILRCLEPDPADRPRSAAAVLARLPGGDPLAAAVAAGQTPSPRLVADADPGDGRLPPVVALALVAVVLIGVLVSGWLGQYITPAHWTRMRDAEPALMRHQAREVLAALGHTEPAGDSAFRYLGNEDFLRQVHRQPNPQPGRWAGRLEGLDDGRPPAMLFFYRTARRPIAPNLHTHPESPGLVNPMSPPPLVPGMADVTLDLRGRLVRFYKVADFLGPADPPAVPPAPDWRPAFVAAGLDYEAFAAHPVPPRHRPPLAADARFAWEGPYPDPRVDRVRVEAASVGGHPVYFVVEFPWEADAASAFPGFSGETWSVVAVLLLFGLPLAAAGLALWNWRAGRADLGGAARLAGVLFALWLARWAFTAHHVMDQREEQLLLPALGLALYQAATVAAFYLALEPVVRKRWPWRLVGWTRLLAGRVRDPLVGRDVLIGLAGGTGLALVIFHHAVGPAWAPELMYPLPLGDYEYDPARSVTHSLTTGVRMGFTFFFLIFLAHWACRNRWVGGAVVVLAFLALYFSLPEAVNKPVSLAFTVTVGAVVLQVIALRFGLLAFVASMLPWGWLLLGGWSLDVRAWYATGPTLGVAVMLALTGYAAYIAVGGRRPSGTSEPEA